MQEERKYGLLGKLARGALVTRLFRIDNLIEGRKIVFKQLGTFSGGGRVEDVCVCSL
jgi:hypothetical protein